ncbi:MAG TPA: ankyrin repeat domain-containing protein, partial [Terracidiphilus sp.]|nr:ankyrin repeat domain-containing protein [Terracidiphilus sp.]
AADNQVLPALSSGNCRLALSANRSSSSWSAAASDGRTAIATVLLEHGADVNRQSSNGNTPLHLAAKWNRIETAKLLLASGADVTIRNENGETPQELATTEEMAALFEKPTAQE